MRARLPPGAVPKGFRVLGFFFGGVHWVLGFRVESLIRILGLRV